jgi:hypothetical protein
MSDLTGALAHKLVRGSEIFPLMSAWGQKRRTDRGSTTSGLPRSTDINRPARFVPMGDIARLLEMKEAASLGGLYSRAKSI